jgi:hypothetical protein
MLYERTSDARAAMRQWNIYLFLAAASQYAPEAQAHREALQKVTITSPADRQRLSGQVVIRGRASAADFFYYKVEFLAPESDRWQVIGDLVYQPVDQGRLATWDTTGLPAGTYLLRLVIVDHTGNFAPPYTIQVRIAP